VYTVGLNPEFYDDQTSREEVVIVYPNSNVYTSINKIFATTCSGADCSLPCRWQRYHAYELSDPEGFILATYQPTIGYHIMW